LENAWDKRDKEIQSKLNKNEIDIKTVDSKEAVSLLTKDDATDDNADNKNINDHNNDHNNDDDNDNDNTLDNDNNNRHTVIVVNPTSIFQNTVSNDKNNHKHQ